MTPTNTTSLELKILIVEDEPLVAEHISTYLNNADFTVCGIAHDDEEARHCLRTQLPDAVILDINLDGNVDGIQLAEFINKQYHLPFLFLTSYADRDTLERAKKVEPWGYIVKPFNEKTLQAVSYTHLDVYKRQDINFEICIQLNT